MSSECFTTTIIVIIVISIIATVEQEIFASTVFAFYLVINFVRCIFAFLAASV